MHAHAFVFVCASDQLIAYRALARPHGTPEIVCSALRIIESKREDTVEAGQDSRYAMSRVTVDVRVRSRRWFEEAGAVTACSMISAVSSSILQHLPTRRKIQIQKGAIISAGRPPTVFTRRNIHIQQFRNHTQSGRPRGVPGMSPGFWGHQAM